MQAKVSDWPAFLGQLEEAGKGVIMTMGKGGVGKTTMAAAIASELARRGHTVVLSTTDPAAHMAQAIGDDLPHLTVERIDPKVETERYVANVLEKNRGNLSADDMALLEEEMRSPCIEEIAVFQAFAHTVAGGERGFVVLDTAPTGHTLLLLDATQSYHREVAKSVGDLPEAVQTLLPRVRDPRFTKVLIVANGAVMPCHFLWHTYAWLQREINTAWENRGDIEPSMEGAKPPTLMDILKLLPKTNCRECGEATCMVFGVRVMEGAKDHNNCRHPGGAYSLFMKGC